MSTYNVRQAMTLAWEYWALSFIQLLFGLAISLAFPMVIYGLLETTTGSAYGEILYERIGAKTDGPEGIQMQFGFFWLILAMVASTVIPGLGKPAHRYRLPSPSLMLVGVPMLCSMITTFAFYVVVAFILNATFDAGWLIWGPAFFAVAAVAWMQAIYWSTCNSDGLLAVVGLTSTIVVIAIAGNGMLTYGNAPFLIKELTALRFLGYVGVMVFSLWLATLGFSKLRHGQGIPVKELVTRVTDLMPAGRTDTPFRSASAAQLWYEFRHRGFVLPAIASVIGAFVLVVACFGEQPARYALGTGATILAICVPCFGMYFGPRKSNGEFGHFFGSRPMTDRRFADAVLKNAAISYVITTLVWAATAGVTYWFFAGGSSDEFLLSWNPQKPWAIANAIWTAFVFWILGWAAVSLISSITLGGRKLSIRILPVMIVCMFLVVGCNTWIDNKTVYNICVCAIAATFVAAFATALSFAYRWKLIGKARVFLALLPLCVALIAITQTNNSIWLNTSIFTTMAVFVGAPFAIAPLSVWTIRHQ